MNNQKAIVLFSGGQDSTTCLFWAIKRWGIENVSTLSFNYGQKHSVELACVKDICETYGIDNILINLDGIFSNSALVEHHKDVSCEHKDFSGLPNSFVPGRNFVFLSIATSVAAAKGVSNIVTGICQTDYSGYPDCRDSFFYSFKETANLSIGEKNKLEFHAPLLMRSKAEIWKLAADLNIIDIVVNKTNTDYNGNRQVLNEWGYGALDNPASELRAIGYYEAKENGWI